MLLGGDAELVAIGIGHDPPPKAGDLVVLDMGAAQADDAGGGGFEIAHRSVQVEAATPRGRLSHPLKGNRRRRLDVAAAAI